MGSVASLLSNMPAMSFSKDAETGRYLACNQSFADYAHKGSPEGVVGLTDAEIFDPETAAHFAVSPSHLSRVFHQETGFGVREYLIHYRIRQACDLLLNSELTVTQIADRCGFSDSNYFGDAFKKATGLSPREYRKLS